MKPRSGSFHLVASGTLEKAVNVSVHLPEVPGESLCRPSVYKGVWWVESAGRSIKGPGVCSTILTCFCFHCCLKEVGSLEIAERSREGKGHKVGDVGRSQNQTLETASLFLLRVF